MSGLSRRQILVGSAAVGLTTLIGACAPAAEPTLAPTAAPPTVAPAETAPVPTAIPPIPAAKAAPPEPTGAPASAPPASAPREPTPTPPGAADLAVVHGADAAAITERALAAIGGIERFVKAGYDVIVKPNICTAYFGPEYAATTNPDVVATLVRLCLGAGAKRVRVMDSPFGGTAAAAYAKSGIEAAVRAAGGEMELMATMAFADTAIPEGRDITSWRVYQPILEADLVINVPIAKHHNLARLTLSGKNLMGTIEDRGSIHRNLGQRIADLASLIRPPLTVMDAVRILMANGPTGGNLNDVKALDTVIAGTDMVAIDAYATRWFDRRPDDVPYIVKEAEMGLGTTDLSSLTIAELAL